MNEFEYEKTIFMNIYFFWNSYVTCNDYVLL